MWRFRVTTGNPSCFICGGLELQLTIPLVLYVESLSYKWRFLSCDLWRVWVKTDDPSCVIREDVELQSLIPPVVYICGDLELQLTIPLVLSVEMLSCNCWSVYGDLELLLTDDPSCVMWATKCLTHASCEIVWLNIHTNEPPCPSYFNLAGSCHRSNHSRWHFAWLGSVAISLVWYMGTGGCFCVKSQPM